MDTTEGGGRMSAAPVISPEIGSRVVVDGLGVNFLEEGEGPPVVLIHGSGPGVTAYANWSTTIPGLATDFRVLAPDVTGFGYTDHRPDGNYTLETWVDHVIGFLNALDLESVHIVGNSFGGSLALALAVRFPERVRRLVLMGSVGLSFELTTGLDEVWGYEPSEGSMRSLLNWFTDDASIITDDLVRSRYDASIRPGFQDTYSALFPAPRQRHVEALATSEESVAALDHEVLIIHGRDDRVIPVASSIRLHQLIPRSQLHVFGQCGHWTQIEQGSRFVTLVRQFLLEDSHT